MNKKKVILVCISQNIVYLCTVP